MEGNPISFDDRTVYLDKSITYASHVGCGSSSKGLVGGDGRKKQDFRQYHRDDHENDAKNRFGCDG